MKKKKRKCWQQVRVGFKIRERNIHIHILFLNLSTCRVLDSRVNHSYLFVFEIILRLFWIRRWAWRRGLGIFWITRILISWFVLAGCCRHCLLVRFILILILLWILGWFFLLRIRFWLLWWNRFRGLIRIMMVRDRLVLWRIKFRCWLWMDVIWGGLWLSRIIRFWCRNGIFMVR